MPPFSRSYVKLPHLGALAQGAFHLRMQYTSLFSEIEDPVGILKVRHVGGFGWDEGFVCPLLPLIQLNKACYLRVIYVLFIHYLV